MPSIKNFLVANFEALKRDFNAIPAACSGPPWRLHICTSRASRFLQCSEAGFVLATSSFTSPRRRRRLCKVPVRILQRGSHMLQQKFSTPFPRRMLWKLQTTIGPRALAEPAFCWSVQACYIKRIQAVCCTVMLQGYSRREPLDLDVQSWRSWEAQTSRL